MIKSKQHISAIFYNSTHRLLHSFVYLTSDVFQVLIGLALLNVAGIHVELSAALLKQ